MKRFYLIFAIIAGVLWGSVGPFVRVMTAGGMNNVTIFFARVLIATIILFFGILIYDRSLFKIRLKDLWIFLIHGCIATVFLNICYNVSITHMSLSLAAVLLALSPVYVVIFAAFLFKEKITTRKIVCMILAIFGSVLVSGVLETGTGGNLTFGYFMIGILSGIMYAVQIIFARIAGDRGYKSFTLTFYCMLLATIVLVWFADFHAIGAFVKSAPLPHFSVLIGQAVLCAVVPYICIALAVMKSEAGLSTILAAAGEPTAATVFGAILFSEIPTILSLGGLILTIVALTFLLLKPRK
ncbi:MAG: DMT family transporter [Lachnospiraceae bacterium]|nr:DMT family transporter [Lachnospiraceae bacterium]